MSNNNINDNNYNDNSVDQISSTIYDLLMQNDQEYNGDNGGSDTSGGNFDDVSTIAERVMSLLRVRTDTDQLKITLITFAIIIVIIGIISNTLFNILIIIRKRFTNASIIMMSMCMAYLSYMIFYCFKISVYLKDISKYHIYDTLETWDFGFSMCQFINGFLITCKLISRFSILLLCIKRILSLFEAKYNDNDDNNITKSCADTDTERDIRDNNSSHHHNKRFLKYIIKLFNWPLILILIVFVWAISFTASIPIFTSYKLTSIHNSTAVICDSIFLFPEESTKVALLTFNYLIFAFVLPSILIIMCLTIIFAVQCTNEESNNNRIKSTTNNFRTNWLLVIIFVVHLVTTLPQEIYKYIRLSTKEEINEEYGIEQSIIDRLTNPTTEARPYYGLQFLYISEFAIIPIIFLIFYAFSSKKLSNLCTLYIKCCDCYEEDEFLTINKNRSKYNMSSTTSSSSNDRNESKVNERLINQNQNNDDNACAVRQYYITNNNDVTDTTPTTVSSKSYTKYNKK